MKNLYKITVVSAILLYIPLFSFSQENNKDKEEDKGFFYMNEDQVIPSMYLEYEEAMKEYKAYLEENEYAYPMRIFSSDDFDYYFSTHLKTGTDISEVDKAYNETAKKDLNKWQEIFRKFEGCYNYNKTYLLYPVLIYCPENDNIDYNAKHYLEMTHAYLHTGKGEEFKENMKKLEEIYKKNKINIVFEVYEGGMGTDQPYFIWIFRGIDQVDFWKKYQEAEKILKKTEETKKLWNKTLKLIRKTETKACFYRPDLSYDTK